MCGHVLGVTGGVGSGGWMGGAAHTFWVPFWTSWRPRSVKFFIFLFKGHLCVEGGGVLGVGGWVVRH